MRVSCPPHIDNIGFCVIVKILIGRRRLNLLYQQKTVRKDGFFSYLKGILPPSCPLRPDVHRDFVGAMGLNERAGDTGFFQAILVI